jgi:hypothetical protein
MLIVMTKFFNEFNYLTWSWNLDIQHYTSIYNDAYGNKYTISISYALFQDHNIDITIESLKLWLQDPFDTNDYNIKTPSWLKYARRDFQITKLG